MRLFAVLLLFLPLALALVPSAGMQAAEGEPEFTEAYLSDSENIALGKELFRQQCSRCHGRGSYPGKAPKLEPAHMPPNEIYLKMTYGFGNMPPWEEVFSDEERMAITAYMKSNIFSN